MNITAQAAIASPAIRKLSGFELFWAFSQIALSGFGGVLPFAYRGLVEQRNWLTASEFAEYLGLSQMLPGATICNVALMVGHKFNGIRGAFCALAGMIFFPFLLVIALGVGYQYFGELTPVKNALKGMGAVAAGLILGTAAKMALKILQETLQRPIRASQVGLAGLAFAGISVLEWKLIYVFGLLAIGGTSLFYVIGRKHGQ
ncbi:chromate transporter [Noviherbaspirillum aerium]|uniref:chromate transporter n=1 Tax=Noviherbaspirillum aerium TaxID=2588497 RepID=UPI00124EEEB8|nr:chromate transporter [Noviherbaspirillum aerium]